MNNRKNFFDIKKHTIFNMLIIGRKLERRFMDELFTENYPDVSPRLACTYFIAELKVLINNLKLDSREHEKACTLKS
ncbi:unnamed protein product [Rhizophagus irregularis]|nr:unnamed protein product [Rhizophagus irregularis]